MLAAVSCVDENLRKPADAGNGEVRIEFAAEAPEEVVEDYEETADEDTPPWDEDGKEDEH